MTGTKAVVVAVVLVASVAHAVSGGLDATFGIGGRIATSWEQPRTLTRQPDGKLLTLLRQGPLLRRLPDGTIDPAFPSGPGAPAGFAFQGLADGRFILANGTTVSRYLADGSLDPSFGMGGSIPTAEGSLTAVVASHDGGIVIAASSGSARRIARYVETGTLDPSFGTGGLVEVAGLAALGPLVEQPDGKLLVTVNDTHAPSLLRLATDGSTDAGFGSGGSVALPLGEHTVLPVSALLVQPDDKIVVSGLAVNRNFRVVRYLADGSADAAFGVAGVVEVDFNAAYDQSYALALQPDGKLLVGGSVNDYEFDVFPGVPPDRPGVVRLLPDGTVDLAFGYGGWVTGERGYVRALLVEPDGRILVASNGVPDGGTLTRYWGGTCGNALTEAGEDCDDGNLLAGDGCDERCCLADADDDGVCDAIDACTVSAATTTRPKVVIRRIGTSGPPGDEKLVMTADLTFDTATLETLHPETTGVRVIVGGPLGPPLDATLPPGAFVPAFGLSPATGWKVRSSPRGPRYIWLGPPQQGLDHLTLAFNRPVPGTIRIQLKGDEGLYAPLAVDLPLAAAVVLDAPAAGGGTCALLSFPGPPPAPACTRNSAGNVLTCR